MKCRLLLLLLLAFGLTACKDNDQQDASSVGSGEGGLSAKGVEECFRSYRSAILDQDGESAVKFVTRSTIDEYQRYVDLALNAEEQELRALSFVNQIQVMIMRHRIDLETLKTLDGRSAIVYAVDRDWVGKNGVTQTSLGEVAIIDSRATAEVFIGDEKSPNRFQFKHEEGSWKIDLVSLIRESNYAMKSAAKQSGLSEDEFLFIVLETISGEKVDPNIWSPLQ